MNISLRQVLFFVIVVGVMTSCANSSRMYLFKDQVPTVQQLDTLKQFAVQHIQASDRIAITIGSTDPALTAYLNPFNIQTAQNGMSTQNVNTNGYLVSNEGNIEFPLLGKVPVAGLTTTEASKMIKEKLSYYYKDLFVNVNLMGRVYFLNGRQGTTIQMVNERLTLFEAIAQSGIQDPYDYKNQLWLVREDSGKRYFVQLDMNSKKIFESPYYYLHSNDVLYLKPGKTTFFTAPNNIYRAVATVLGSLAAVLIAIKTL